MSAVDLEPLEEGDALLLPKPPDIKVKTEKTIEGTYKILEELGKGKFGVVKKCKDSATGICHAAKYVKKTQQSKQDVANEIEMMGKLHHKGLVQLIDAFETPQYMIVVMELITGGELFEKVVEEDNLTERQVVRYLRQVLFAVQHMHRYKMAHLDLKPENILCVGGDPPGYEKLKLIDLGMARILEEGKDEIAVCGTAEFVAPEVLRLEPISLAADMWSLGVITYVLLSGLSPFLGDNDNETLRNVASGDYDFDDGEGIFDQISDTAKQFMESLLVMDVKERHTVDGCLEHEWLTSAKEKKLKTDKLRKFIARRRWQKTTNALKALNRLGHMGLLHRSANTKNNEQNTNQVATKENGAKTNKKEADVKSDKVVEQNKADSDHASNENINKNDVQSKDDQPKDKSAQKDEDATQDKNKANEQETALTDMAKNDSPEKKQEQKTITNNIPKQEKIKTETKDESVEAEQKTPESNTQSNSSKSENQDRASENKSNIENEMPAARVRREAGAHHNQRVTETTTTEANVVINSDHNDNVTEQKAMIVVNMNDLRDKDDVIHVHIDSSNFNVTKN